MHHALIVGQICSETAYVAVARLSINGEGSCVTAVRIKGWRKKGVYSLWSSTLSVRFWPIVINQCIRWS